MRIESTSPGCSPLSSPLPPAPVPHIQQFRLRLTADAETMDGFADALGSTLDPEATAIAQWEESDGVWLVEAYYDHAPDLAVLTNLIAETAAANRITAPSVSFGPVEERDWVRESLKHLKPIHAGRFLLYGSHDRDQRKPGRINLEIDAGLAFGTGHHGTTLGCLQALTDLLKTTRPRRVLDLGCGTGVLAIAAAKHTRNLVLASDIDPVATQTARENARRNAARSLVKTVTAPGLHHIEIKRQAPFDLVLANILAGPLVALAPGIAGIVSVRGKIVLSGLLRRQERRIIAAYRAQGMVLEKRIRIDEWSTLILSRNG